MREAARGDKTWPLMPLETVKGYIALSNKQVAVLSP